MKGCTKCGETKSLDEFYGDKRTGDGKGSRCKECIRSKARENYAENSELFNARTKAFVENNREAVRERRKKAYAKNPHKARETARKRRLGREDELNEKRRKWYQENREHARQYKQGRAEENRVYAKLWYHRTKHTVDAQQKQMQRTVLSNFLRNIGGSRSGRTSEILGYTLRDLQVRLALNFQPGMSWDNHGEWHIDHTIPVAHFIRKGEKRPHIVNALCNLRPMWAAENIRKSDSLPDWMT